MEAADTGSWDTNDLGADGNSQRPGIPEIPGIYGDPQPRPGRAHTHTHVLASPPHRAGPARGFRDALALAHDRAGTS